MSKLTRQQFVCLLLLMAILVTLAFIFGNSMASPQQSGAASDRVNHVISAVMEFVTGRQDSGPERFLTAYSRKIAHMVEFALLGCEVIWLLQVSRRRSAAHLVAGAFFGFVAASADEFIQSFTGRGDLVSDIWIDVSGYIAAYGLTACCLFVFAWRKSPLTHTPTVGEGSTSQKGSL